MKRNNDKRSDRSGAALILVVGMLTLMTLMGAAFAIYMRTERMAAGNYSRETKSRQLLYAALSMALEEIDESCGNKSYPPWVYECSTGLVSCVNSITNNIDDIIPGDVNRLIGTNTPKVYWVDVGSNSDSRVAYVVYNCSGLLDANFAGGETNRGVGAKLEELQFDFLSDVDDKESLTNGRPYLTQQELVAIGTNPAAESAQGGSAAFKKYPQYFVTYSRFPDDGKVYIGGTVSNLIADRAAIIQAFTDAGCPNPDILFTNLVDYVDEDSIPGNLGTTGMFAIVDSDLIVPCVEAVPMFNEFWVTNTASNIVVNGTNFWGADCKIRFEYAKPFKPVTPSIGFRWRIPYKVEFTTSYSDGSPSTKTFVASTNISYFSSSPSYDVRPASASFATSSIIVPTNVNIRVTVYNVTVSNETEGAIVDLVRQVPPISANVPLDSGVGSTAMGWECRDPRDNNGFAGPSWFQTTTNSLYSINRETINLMKLSGNDGDTNNTEYMYVRNGSLRTVGELGCLYYGVMGRTVSLYKDASRGRTLNKVLDYFTVDMPGVNKYASKVHLGSQHTNVIKEVYDGMPRAFDGYGDPIGDSQRDIAVSNLMAVVTDIKNNSGVVKLSDIGTVEWADVFEDMTTWNDLDREAFVRHAAGLFGVRQNYFLIVLYVQASKVDMPVVGDDLLVGTRAIAEVWRDSQTNSAGRHPVIVRSVRLLNE